MGAINPPYSPPPPSPSPLPAPSLPTLTGASPNLTSGWRLHSHEHHQSEQGWGFGFGRGPATLNGGGNMGERGRGCLEGGSEREKHTSSPVWWGPDASNSQWVYSLSLQHLFVWVFVWRWRGGWRGPGDVAVWKLLEPSDRAGMPLSSQSSGPVRGAIYMGSRGSELAVVQLHSCHSASSSLGYDPKQVWWG